MLVWNMDKNNELGITESGQINLVNKLDALKVRLDAALQVIKGEVEDTDQGVDYFGIVLTDTPLSIKVQEICRIITSIDEVLDVKFLRAETNSKDNSLTFYFEINSVYGDLEYDNTFENL